MPFRIVACTFPDNLSRNSRRREEIKRFRQDENVGYGNHQRKQQPLTVTNLKHPLFKTATIKERNPLN